MYEARKLFILFIQASHESYAHQRRHAFGCEKNGNQSPAPLKAKYMKINKKTNKIKWGQRPAADNRLFPAAYPPAPLLLSWLSILFVGRLVEWKVRGLGHKRCFQHFKIWIQKYERKNLPILSQFLIGFYMHSEKKWYSVNWKIIFIEWNNEIVSSLVNNCSFINRVTFCLTQLINKKMIYFIQINRINKQQ